MSANPFRLDIDPFLNPFDTCVVGGEYLPGLIAVGKPSRTFKWDKKEGPGTQGDSLTYRGSRLVDFVIDLTFWESEQVDEWDAKRPALEPDPKNIRALDIVHPTLERLKVRAIVIAEIVELFHRGQGGAWGAQLGVNEYKAAPKVNASGSPTGSSSSSSGLNPSGNAPKPAKTAQEEEIERLLKLAKEP